MEKCVSNCLRVNLKKTKVVIFQQEGRAPIFFFFCNGELVEIADSYKYVRIMFSSKCTFSHCQDDLYKMALKAQFKLTKSFMDTNISIISSIHLFDHTIKPVALYGSEIWGTINTNSSIINNVDYSIDKSFTNIPCDKLQIKFLKFILHVNTHKKASNDAVLWELGRHPLYVYVLIKYK